VFYEKRPSKNTKVGENFSWELAAFEMIALEADKFTKNAKYIHKRNVEYTALTVVSIALISILLVVLLFYIFTEGGEGKIACIIVSLIYVIYIGVSIRWVLEIPKYTSLKDNFGLKKRYMEYFAQYALDTEHYTIDELKDRLGDILNYLNIKS